MRLLGYARISTGEQELAPQRQALEAAGCSEIVEETASGADRTRPQLAALLARTGPGDTLVVVRIDRLARSLAHLLAVIEELGRRGAKFRSLGDPIDTSQPGGTLVLQILGAVAEFERALIRERTLSGLAAARSLGRVGGNPSLRARDPAAIAALGRARRAARLAAAAPETWLDTVRGLRPGTPWGEVAGVVNRGLPPSIRPFTAARLAGLARLFVGQGALPQTVLLPARAKLLPAAAAGRPIEIAAAYLRGRPDASLVELGTQLLRLGVRPPRGGATWAPSSLKALLDRGRAMGLVGPG
jgi:DNA invertase Pin-like site-specific DNA recombinase